jgi:hypothetical protein
MAGSTQVAKLSQIEGWQRSVARRIEFIGADQADLPCPLPLQKTFLFFRSANQSYDLSSHPERGALANVINAGRVAVDADGAFDESV